MDVTKKTYEAPEMEVIVIEQADIIATSTGYNQGPIIINNGEDLIIEEQTW